MISAATLALLGAVSYLVAYAGVMVGAEAGHLSRLLASVPTDPSESQARVLVERIGLRTDERPRRPCPRSHRGRCVSICTDAPDVDGPRIPDRPPE